MSLTEGGTTFDIVAAQTFVAGGASGAAGAGTGEAGAAGASLPLTCRAIRRGLAAGDEASRLGRSGVGTDRCSDARRDGGSEHVY